MLISRNAALLTMLAALNGFALPTFAASPAPSPSLDKRVAACLACHTLQDQVTREGYFPRIAGKPAGYLYNQLLNFRDGRRQYPPMTWMVSQLSDDYLREIADYFSQIKAPYPPPPPANVPPATLERGKQLALQGDASRKLPACVACHGQTLTGVAPAIPALLGLPRDYLNAQFGAWQNGARRAGKPDCMASITERLGNEDILAVTAWLSSQPMPAQSAPVAAARDPLPLSCGSVPGSAK